MKCNINELCNLKILQCVITGRGEEKVNTQNDFFRTPRGTGQKGEAGIRVTAAEKCLYVCLFICIYVNGRERERKKLLIV